MTHLCDLRPPHHLPHDATHIAYIETNRGTHRRYTCRDCHLDHRVTRLIPLLRKEATA